MTIRGSFATLLKTVTLLMLSGCPNETIVSCPDTPIGSYIGSAIVLEEGCTLDVGDVASYDAVLDTETLPHPEESCSANFVGHIDGWLYDGRISYVSDTTWTFDGYVQGKHCRLNLLVTATKAER